MLKNLPTYADAQLVRTRDPAQLAECHTVVDVGGEYDDNAKRYDHHQRGFDTVFPGHNTKLSSAGLVYLHFGKDIISAVTGLPEGAVRDPPFDKIYTDFIEAFDANDNGVNVWYDEGITPGEEFPERLGNAITIRRCQFIHRPNSGGRIFHR